jgi:hypothetical protein
VKDFIDSAVATYCRDYISLLRPRAKATCITAFPDHTNFDTMSKPALLGHGGPQRLVVSYFAINHEAQEFLAITGLMRAQLSGKARAGFTTGGLKLVGNQ